VPLPKISLLLGQLQSRIRKDLRLARTGALGHVIRSLALNRNVGRYRGLRIAGRRVLSRLRGDTLIRILVLTHSLINPAERSQQTTVLQLSYSTKALPKQENSLSLRT